jgi:hypothetical protein
MWNYRWKEGSDQPEQDFKDFADTVRYVAMEQPVYRSPELDEVLMHMPPVEAYNPLTYGLVMR